MASPAQTEEPSIDPTEEPLAEPTEEPSTEPSAEPAEEAVADEKVTAIESSFENRKVSVSLDAEMEQGIQLMLGTGTFDKTSLSETVSGSGIILGTELFDISLTDENGAEAELPAETTATVCVSFSKPIFVGEEYTSASSYVVLHQKKDNTVEIVKTMPAGDSGLSGVSFEVSSFSPFAVVALAQKQTEEVIIDKIPVNETSPQTFDMASWITKVIMEVKEGESYVTVKDGQLLQADDDVKITMEYVVPSNTVFSSSDKIVYDIPDFLYCLTEVSDGKVMDEQKDVEIGTYTIVPDGEGGLLTIQFDEEGASVHVALAVVMKYGYSIPKVCKAVQDRVKSAIENMAGLKVCDVNINIVGVETETEK